MADILISKFTTQIPRVGATPATPGFAESEGQDPVAPSGTPQVYTPVTIGSPANGLSISGSQVLTIGLASTSATGALSSTDWNTFNGKIGGSIASGQVAFGTGVNTVGGDSGLTWNNTTKQLSVGSVANSIAIATIGSIRIRSRSDSFQGGFVQIRHNASDVLDAGFILESVKNGIVNTRIDVGLDNISFNTNSLGNAHIQRWRITSVGDFEAIDGKNIRSSNNGNINIIPNGTGLVGIATTSPTNTLDVNGTARIRTISNLGTAATSVLVPSATGVVSLRTLAELASDGTFITGTGTSGRVAFWSGTGTQSSDSSLLWNNTTKTLEIQFSGVSVADRGLIISQYSNDVAAPAFQAFKARGTNASPLNVNAGDLVSAFAYRPRIGGVFVLDRALFGAVMTSSTGISQYFISGTTNENYIPNLIVHHSGGVGIGLGGNIILNTVVAPTARLDVRGFGTTTGLTAILENSSGTNNVEFVDNGQIRFLRLPTSSAGLAAGSLWNNGGVLNIV